MSKAKDEFMSVRIQAETDLEHWESLPEKYKELFEVKRIEADKINGVDAKEVYKKCEIWKALHKEMVEAIKKRTEREEQIRVENR